MEETRWLIVGGGIAGLSTAWHLAQAGQGHDTLLLEAEPHLAAHSSAQNAAILRTLCGDPISSEIAASGARRLREPPPGFSDVPLVDARGLVFVAGPERAEEVGAWVRRAQGDVRIAPLAPEELAALAPAFEGKIAAAWSFPEEGRIDIGALVAGFARGARAGGVSLQRSRPVSELLTESGRVVGARLKDGSEVRAETTLLAAGGWADRLAAGAGSPVRLRPTRRHLLVTGPTAEVERGWPVVWYFGEQEFYCRPESGGMLLCACEITDVDPDDYRPDPEVRALIAERAEQHLPRLSDAGAAHFWSGVRTLTADDRFAIGPDPDLPGLFWVAGLGGAGMVCSFEVGRIAAAQLLGEFVAPAWLEGLAPARLAERDGAAPAFA